MGKTEKGKFGWRGEKSVNGGDKRGVKKGRDGTTDARRLTQIESQF
jgi:hypothetical protein